MIIDGKKIAEEIAQELQQKIRAHHLELTLAIVLCGNNPESQLYTSMKKEKAYQLGIKADIHHLAENITTEQFQHKIGLLNMVADGIIIQLPLPPHLDTGAIVNTINPDKDVDGLTAISLGKLARGDETFAPATPKAVIALLEKQQITLSGKEVVIINRSAIVGKPLAFMLLNRGATVTICHSQTKDLVLHTRRADIIITGVGQKNFLTADMIQEQAIVIDVGTTKDGHTVFGDAASDIAAKASWYTPVPGGVGPMTVIMLLKNLVDAKLKAKYP